MKPCLNLEAAPITLSPAYFTVALVDPYALAAPPYVLFHTLLAVLPGLRAASSIPAYAPVIVCLAPCFMPEIPPLDLTNAAPIPAALAPPNNPAAAPIPAPVPPHPSGEAPNPIVAPPARPPI
mgnify:FL=1